jgi:hypothetical protein
MNTIVSVVLDSKHPIWPGETLYALKNLQSGKIGLGRYTTMERAEYWLEQRNRKS